MAIGVVEAIYRFNFLLTKKHSENYKSTGKTQGKHRKFSLNQSVATLKNITFRQCNLFVVICSNCSCICN